MKNLYLDNEPISKSQSSKLIQHLQNGLNECGGIRNIDLYEGIITEQVEKSHDITELLGLGSSSKSSAGAVIERWLSEQHREKQREYDRYAPCPEPDENYSDDTSAILCPSPGSRGSNADLALLAGIFKLCAAIGIIYLCIAYPIVFVAIIFGCVGYALLKATG